MNAPSKRRHADPVHIFEPLEGEEYVQEPEGVQPAKVWVRVASALVYGILLLGAVLLGEVAVDGVKLGSIPLGIVVGVYAAITASEFFAMNREEHRLPNEFFGVAAAFLMPIAGSLFGAAGVFAVLTALVAASLVWHVTWLRVSTLDTALTVFGAVYTGFLLSYLVLIREYGHSSLAVGGTLVVVTLASVWLNDSGAYFVGSTLGRHKMAPRISPKKSWEGFWGGFAVTVLVWAAVPYLPWLPPRFPLTLPWSLLTGAAIGLAAVTGDLFESRLKREAGVKDSGNLLPGHGGFMDRMDSTILVCLVAWWMLWWGGVR